MGCPVHVVLSFCDLCFPSTCQCDSHLENTKPHVSLSLPSVGSFFLFMRKHCIPDTIFRNILRINVSCKCMSEMVFSAKRLMGVFFPSDVCFQIQQFNEKLKDQTGNPWQQPRNPRFVMLSMLHCKQIQAAYQGCKHRKDLLSRARSLPLRTWMFFPSCAKQLSNSSQRNR